MIKKKLKLWILFILFENVKYLNHVRIISKITDLFVFYVFQLLSLSHCGLISLKTNSLCLFGPLISTGLCKITAQKSVLILNLKII